MAVWLHLSDHPPPSAQRLTVVCSVTQIRPDAIRMATALSTTVYARAWLVQSLPDCRGPGL